MKKIAVIGVGSAGIVCISHLLAWLKGSEWQITSIHNPKKNILGIGESTNPSFTNNLEYGLNFDYNTDLTPLNGTIKFGSKFVGWRNHEFINPLMGGAVAIHFNSSKLQAFAFDRFNTQWKNKFNELIGDVSEIKSDSTCATITVDGVNHEFDFVIDCSGFPKSYEEYEIIHPETVNRCLVHNIDEDNESTNQWNYTLHKATPDGWMFGVPLTNRKSYGYLFNDNITDVSDAKKNFANIINVPEDKLDDIEYKFKSYRAKKLIDGRIIKNGNAACFFEPLSANSLFIYDTINKLIIDYIEDGDLSKADECNYNFYGVSNQVITMIHFFYKGGSTYKTDFWNITSKKSEKFIETDSTFMEIQKHLTKMNSDRHYYPIVSIFNSKNFILLDSDSHFGYNTFKK
jgi:hypothetical protein